MNTLIKYKRNFVAVCFILLAVISNTFASTPSNTEIAARLINLNTVIDIQVDDSVTDLILSLVEKRKNESEIILGRTSLYFPLIENSIREKGLPDELKYIAVIESSLNPHGVSSRGATGLWQFMKGTAEILGLKVGKYVDERKDLAKSTDKALEYLNILYNQYNDWTLALAAYNCGSGNVNKAIKKAGGEANYWAIRQYLPKETRRYIPKFIAVSYMMNYYYLHDLQPREPQEEIKYTITANVYDNVEFSKLSKDLEMDFDLIRYLNPSYIKNMIPANENHPLSLTLPDLKMVTFLQKHDGYIDVIDKPFVARRGSFFNGSYYISSENIASSVEILPNILIASHTTRDNLKGDHRQYLDEIKKDLTKIKSTEFVQYQLRRKESLADVAANYNVSLDELMAYNNIYSEADLAPGSIIRIIR